MLTRRCFLRTSGLDRSASSGRRQDGCCAPPPRAAASRKILVAIFQRGAADGLNIVVPFFEKRYYQLRPSIAVARPSATTPNGAIDLDGRFALHPSLQPLKPLWDSGQLAIVHAAGSPDPSRSHFDAQEFMECGHAGRQDAKTAG